MTKKKELSEYVFVESGLSLTTPKYFYDSDKLAVQLSKDCSHILTRYGINSVPVKRKSMGGGIEFAGLWNELITSLKHYKELGGIISVLKNAYTGWKWARKMRIKEDPGVIIHTILGVRKENLFFVLSENEDENNDFIDGYKHEIKNLLLFCNILEIEMPKLYPAYRFQFSAYSSIFPVGAGLLINIPYNKRIMSNMKPIEKALKKKKLTSNRSIHLNFNNNLITKLFRKINVEVFEDDRLYSDSLDIIK